MKATNFKEIRPPKTHRDKSRCFVTGKKKLSQALAEKRATSSDDIKGGLVAYSCPHAPHWHVGHDPSKPTVIQEAIKETRQV